MEIQGKTEEKKRKAYPGIPLLGGGGSGASSLSMGVAQVGRGASTFSRFSAVMTSPAAIMATVTAAFTISGIGLTDMSRRGVFKNGIHLGGSGVALHDSAAPVSGEDLPGAEPYSSSLEMASRANPGAFGAAASAEEPVAEEEAAGEEEVAEADGSAALGAGGELDKVDEVEKSLADGVEEGKKASPKEPVGKLTAKLAGAKVGGTLSLGSGGGMSSGIGRGFDQMAESPGRAQALSQGRKAQVTRSKSASRGRGKTALRGATAKRLSNMNRAMAGARRAGTAEAAAVHNRQWTGAADTGQAIGGAGTGIAGGGPTAGEGGAGLQNGGPLSSASGGQDGAAAEEVKKVGRSKNVTPWQKEMDLVMILLPIAGLLLLAATLLAKMQQYAIAKMLAYAATAIAAVVTVIGIMIMSKGQALQGGMIAGVGGILTVMSYMAAQGIDQEAKEAELQQLVDKGHMTSVDKLSSESVTNLSESADPSKFGPKDLVYNKADSSYYYKNPLGDMDMTQTYSKVDVGKLNMKNFAVAKPS